MKKINYFISLMFVTILSFGQNVPIDFETGGNGDSWTWTVFENTSNPALEIVANPDPSGINVSSTVAKFTALQTGQPWAGCESLHGSDIGSFSINSTNKIIRIMVYKTKISDVGIKLVTSSSWSTGEIKVANTLVNQWEEISFDFSSHIGNGQTYDQIVIFPDFVARAADDTIYFDNVMLGDASNVYGCMDSTYVEYDPLANVDNGSCNTLAIKGCMDSTYLEYNSLANVDDGSCATLIVSGCLDSTYLEYNALANVDDGSCNNLIVNGCMDSNYVEYNALANVDDGSCNQLINGVETLINNDYSFNVFPNPTTGETFISFKGFDKGSIEISIQSIIGSNVISVIKNVSSNENKISITDHISTLENGTYLVKVKFDDKILIRKVTKK